MIFNSDYIDFINILTKNQVKFVLVGGLAVVVHGHFRTTKDMDIYYEGTFENCNKLKKSIEEFGFGYLKFTEADLMDKSSYIKLGNAPIRIDLFCDLPALEFNDVYGLSLLYEEEDFKVKVIHVNHLIENKKSVGRLQDRDDVKKLQKIIALRKNK
jgi:hypothetical protein